MDTLIGIDVGTSATRAVLIAMDGAVLAKASREHGVLEPLPGRAEHDAEAMWWSETLSVLREIANAAPEAAKAAKAIGISTIGASIVPVDEQGRALRNAILYGIDRRALSQMNAVGSELGSQAILARTGREVSTQSVGPKIRWIAEEEPNIAARTMAYLPPTAYLSRRLCGRAAVDPHTALAVHPLFRADRMEWDREFLSRFCRVDQLPEVVAAGTPLASLLPEVAEAVGLPADIPVCCGTADVLAEGLGCGATRAGDAIVMYGSTLFVIHLNDIFQPHPPFWASVYPAFGLNCLTAGTSTAGAAAEWLIRLLGCREATEREALMTRAGAVRAAEDGLIFLPYLRGERAPIFNPHARGVFFGLTTAHDNAHLYRAVLESIGFSLRHVLDEMRIAPLRVFAAGGGSALDLPLQLAVNSSGFPQLRARQGRSAAFGAAVLAGLGVGRLTLEDLDDQFYGGFDMIEPAADGSIQAGYRIYREVADRCAPLFREADDGG